MSGHVVGVWSPQGARWTPELQSQINASCGAFSYTPVIRDNQSGAWAQRFAEQRELVALALMQARRGQFDAVVVYGLGRTGRAAARVAEVLNIPLVVQVPGVPGRSFQVDGSSFGNLRAALFRRAAERVLERAAGVHLLFPEQLAGLRPLRTETTVATFPDFVALDLVPVASAPQPEVLCVGYPWRLKGVDLLIRAFLAVADRYPTFRLRVAGYCGDPAPFAAMTRGHPRIVLEPFGRSHQDVLGMIASAAVFALPSRTEAMGRVLIEAMAAGRPVIGSRVDGIPYYLEHERTGLLCEPDSVSSLSEQLDRLLSNPSLRMQLGEAARLRAHEAYGPGVFCEELSRLITSVAAASNGLRSAA